MALAISGEDDVNNKVNVFRHSRSEGWAQILKEGNGRRKINVDRDLQVGRARKIYYKSKFKVRE